MFVVMASVRPRPGKQDEMADRMRAFRDILRTKPGLVKTVILREDGENTLVGLSMWTDKAAYENAMASIQATPSTGSSEALREAPPEMRLFVEV